MIRFADRHGFGEQLLDTVESVPERLCPQNSQQILHNMIEARLDSLNNQANSENINTSCVFICILG
jgi:hypothetical protein